MTARAPDNLWAYNAPSVDVLAAHAPPGSNILDAVLVTAPDLAHGFDFGLIGDDNSYLLEEGGTGFLYTDHHVILGDEVTVWVWFKASAPSSGSATQLVFADDLGINLFLLAGPDNFGISFGGANVVSLTPRAYDTWHLAMLKIDNVSGDGTAYFNGSPISTFNTMDDDLGGIGWWGGDATTNTTTHLRLELRSPSYLGALVSDAAAADLYAAGPAHDPSVTSGAWTGINPPLRWSGPFGGIGDIDPSDYLPDNTPTKAIVNAGSGGEAFLAHYNLGSGADVSQVGSEAIATDWSEGEWFALVLTTPRGFCGVQYAKIWINAHGFVQLAPDPTAEPPAFTSSRGLVGDDDRIILAPWWAPLVASGDPLIAYLEGTDDTLSIIWRGSRGAGSLGFWQIPNTGSSKVRAPLDGFGDPTAAAAAFAEQFFLGASVLFWLRVTLSDEGGFVIDIWTGAEPTTGPFNSIGMYLAAGGDWVAYVTTLNYLMEGSGATSSGFPFNQWSFMSIETDASTGEAKLYRDATLISTTTGAAPDPGGEGSAPGRVVFTNTANPNAFDMTNVMPLPRNLTSDERLALTAAGPGHNYVDPFDDGLGHVWAGLSGDDLPTHYYPNGEIDNQGTAGACTLDVVGDASVESEASAGASATRQFALRWSSKDLAFIYDALDGDPEADEDAAVGVKNGDTFRSPHDEADGSDATHPNGGHSTLEHAKIDLGLDAWPELVTAGAFYLFSWGAFAAGIVRAFASGTHQITIIREIGWGATDFDPMRWSIAFEEEGLELELGEAPRVGHVEDLGDGRLLLRLDAALVSGRSYELTPPGWGEEPPLLVDGLHRDLALQHTPDRRALVDFDAPVLRPDAQPGFQRAGGNFAKTSGREVIIKACWSALIDEPGARYWNPLHGGIIDPQAPIPPDSTVRETEKRQAAQLARLPFVKAAVVQYINDGDHLVLVWRVRTELGVVDDRRRLT